MSNYRPQTKIAKVMFSHVSVCPQGGVCLWSWWTCRKPPRQISSGQTVWADTPLPRQTPSWADAPGQTLLLRSTCWDMVNKRAVRIPLECILVSYLSTSFGTNNKGNCKYMGIQSRHCATQRQLCAFMKNPITKLISWIN